MTFAELKEACRAAGITPGRSAEECRRRLTSATATKKKPRLTAFRGLLNATAIKSDSIGLNRYVYTGQTGWPRGFAGRPSSHAPHLQLVGHVGKGLVIRADGSTFAECRG